MKKREPPRIGTDEDYQAIEKAAGIETPNDAFRRQLSIHIEHCRKRLEAGNRDFRHSVFLKAVKRIRKKALGLLDDLTGQGKYADDSEKAWANDAASIWLTGKLDVEHLRELIGEADVILDVMTGIGGRPADANVQMLLEDLTSLYEEVTGRKAGVTYHGIYQGPFFRFVKEIIDRLAPTLCQEDDTLGKALQRHLKR